ncbi:MAG: Glu/Leu/Phe/Val dehydrogenase dimerization domain-containing protein [Candidatus Omnitrophota bacterium]
MFKRICSLIVLTAFLWSCVLGPEFAHAQALFLPEPGVMLQTSAAFVPVSLQGLTVHLDDPLLFDFIVDTGNTGLIPGKDDNAAISAASQALIKYFLASLTISDKDQWVNLSPDEKDRIVPEGLGKTDLGRDMLAQDYVLKQVTASMIYPERELGKEFWRRVYERAQTELGTAAADIPTDMFNKVWIVTDKAAVYVHKDPKAPSLLTAVLTEAHLKVMLDSDYKAMNNSRGNDAAGAADERAKQLVREIILPELEKEVNTGANFATLRQIHQAVVLATWYKRNLKDALLTRAYADRGKTGGVEGLWVTDRRADIDPEQIWNKYVEAYKKGVFNFIKDDIDPATGEIVPRKYFSGGDNPIPVVIRSSGKSEVPLSVGRTVKVTAAARLDAAEKATTPDAFIRAVENPYWTKMLARVEKIARMAGDLNPAVVRQLLQPENVFKGWEFATFNTPSGEAFQGQFFHARVISNTTLGPAKGGIRWVLASDLMADPEFVEQWKAFNALGPVEGEARDFIAKWIEGEAKALALGMTLKTAGSRLKLGGGKGAAFIGRIVRTPRADGTLSWSLQDYYADAGVATDWAKFPAVSKARIARAHARAMARSNKIGPNKDIPAPDMRTNAEILQWYADEYLRYLVVETDIIKKYNLELYSALLELTLVQSDPVKTPYLEKAYEFWKTTHIPVPWLGVFTGKDPKVYGVAGRGEATGFGVVDIVKFFIPDLSGKTASVNGMGNVGSYTCLGLVKNGARLKVINDAGITLTKQGDAVWTEAEIQLIIDQHLPLRDIWEKGLLSRDGVTAVLDDPKAVASAVFGADVDILIPAAKENVITEEVAKIIRAGWVFEGANGPTTAPADILLVSKGIKVVPDTLANAGGVIVSSYETDQTNGDHLLTVEETGAWRTRSLEEAARAVQAELRSDPKMTMRQAFDLAAIRHIVKTKYAQLIALYRGDLELMGWGIDPASPQPEAELRKDIIALGLEQELQQAGKSVGGIDLASGNALVVSGDAGTMNISPVAWEQLKNGDFIGITPVILQLTPLAGILGTE